MCSTTRGPAGVRAGEETACRIRRATLLVTLRTQSRGDDQARAVSRWRGSPTGGLLPRTNSSWSANDCSVARCDRPKGVPRTSEWSCSRGVQLTNPLRDHPTCRPQSNSRSQCPGIFQTRMITSPSGPRIPGVGWGRLMGLLLTRSGVQLCAWHWSAYVLGGDSRGRIKKPAHTPAAAREPRTAIRPD